MLPLICAAFLLGYSGDLPPVTYVAAHPVCRLAGFPTCDGLTSASWVNGHAQIVSTYLPTASYALKVQEAGNAINFWRMSKHEATFTHDQMERIGRRLYERAGECE